MRRFLFFIMMATVLSGSCSRPASPGDDKISGNDPGEADGKLRIMAYNIHHANPPSKSGYIDIDAIVRVIKNQDPDLVALQEVDVNTERSGNIDEAGVIAEKLDMEVFFGKAIGYQGGEYGVAILSRYPLSEEMVYQLPTQEGSEQRVLATATVSLPDGTAVKFGSTHLDHKRDPVNRISQISRILEVAGEEELPFIIAGDFNAVPGSEVIDMLDAHFQRTCNVCPPTIPVLEPEKAIDFIAYDHPSDKFSVASHKVISEKYASDHLPVVAVIDIH